MRAFVLTVGLGAGLLLFAGRADAQWRYADDKGVTQVTQYKLGIPAQYRDAAVWVGPRGVGKPALSAEARQTKRRAEEYHRIGVANANNTKRQAPAGVTMCIAGEQQLMTSPGHWKVVGPCPSGFSTR